MAERFIFLAWLISNRQIKGVRIMDINEKETKDIPLNSAINTFTKIPNLLENAVFNPMDRTSYGLVGTQGDLRAYPQVEMGTKKAVGSFLNRMYIITNLQGLGYEAVLYNGKILKIAKQQAIEYAKNNLFCNATIVNTAHGEEVVSLGAEFPVKQLVKSKYNGNVSMGSMVRVGTNRTNLAKQVKQDTEIETDYQDSFGSLSPAQRNALVAFYTWYTVDTYEKIAKTKKLNVNPNKLAKLSSLRGETDWTFGGIIDSYLDGRIDGKCSLGHSLRYEYFAVPSEEFEKKGLNRWRMRAKARNDARSLYDEMGAIVFGETCASDFFDISKEDMSKLVKIRQDMSSEIALTTQIVTNNQIEEYKKKHELLSAVIDKLGSSENLAKAFGNEVAASLSNFMMAGIPFTKSLVIQAAKSAYTHREFILNTLFSGYVNELKPLLEYVKTDNGSELTRRRWDLFDYFFKYSLEGAYQYDPLHDQDKIRKDVGKYNKDTRAERSILLRKILTCTGVRAEKMTLGDIEKFLEVLKLDKRFKNILGGVLPETKAVRVFGIPEEAVFKSFKVIRYITYDSERDIVEKKLHPLASWVSRVYKINNGDVTLATHFVISSYTNSLREIYASNDDWIKDFSLAVNQVQDGIDTIARNCMKDRIYDYKKLVGDDKKVDAFILDDESLLKEPEPKIEEPETKVEEPETKVEEPREEKAESTQEKVESAQEKTKKKRLYTEKDLKDLKDLLKKHGTFENPEDYGLKVALAIVQKGTSWDKMSSKQRWRIGNTVDRIKAGDLK